MSSLFGLEQIELGEKEQAQLGVRASELLLRKAWPRRRGGLLLEYEAGPGLAVAGQWLPEGAADARRIARLTARSGPAVAVPHAGVVLQADGADRRLGELGSLARRVDARLVAHRPERRGVVKLGRSRHVSYAKVVPPNRVAGIVRGARVIRAVDGVESPRLVHADPTTGVTVWNELRGPTLRELSDRRRRLAAARVGRAVRRLHDSTADPALPTHDAGAEQKVLERWLGVVAAVLPAHGRAVGAALPPVSAALEAGTRVFVPSHRDLHDAQIVLGPGGAVGLLDTDTLALAEPALDLANLLVHLELRSLHRGSPEAPAWDVAGALLEGYAPSDATLERLGAYADAARIRLACVYALRPGEGDTPALLLERLGAPPPGLGRC